MTTMASAAGLIGITGTNARPSIAPTFGVENMMGTNPLAFAFPMIRKMLMLLNLTNIRLFALTTVISFVVFALFYVLVYRITSNAYFHIVRGTRSRG